MSERECEISEVWVKGRAVCGEDGQTTVEIQGLTQRVAVVVPNDTIKEVGGRPERIARKVLEETIAGARQVVASNQGGRTTTEALAIMRDCAAQLAGMEREGR